MRLEDDIIIIILIDMKHAHKKYFPITLLFIMMGFFTLPQQGQAQTIIRDTEIESYLNDWFTPIFEASGMSPRQVKIILVQDNDVNAFVAGGSNIFFYTGLIEKTDNPGELIGVMAHELGHISGGHLVRGREAMEQASYESLLGTIIGLGAAVASGDAGGVAAGSLAGSSVAQRRFLSKARTIESSADQAAISSMNKAGMNPAPFLTFLQKLEGQELLTASQQSEYIRSHPLTRNRIETVRTKIEKSPNTERAYPTQWTEQHARMKAKLMGFINPGQVEWQYDSKDTSISALYARTVADYRQNRIESALNNIDTLISREPNNPYFHELKGQMLVDFGRVAEGKKDYERAITLRPNSGLIRTSLAHAQIETAGEDKQKLQQAIDNLKRAAQDEPRSTRVQRLLATAYGRMGDDAMARLHLAEEALLQQKYPYAKQQATMALKNLKPSTPAALRANDILRYVEQKKPS
jgi:predicted Zn-dependent protease